MNDKQSLLEEFQKLFAKWGGERDKREAVEFDLEKWKTRALEAEKLPFRYQYPRPAVTVDIAVFTYISHSLHVLLIGRAKEPFKGCWALPGGFVDENEDLIKAAYRELKEETEVTQAILQQIGVFGTPGRDPRGHTVSIAYAGYTRDTTFKAGDDAADARWHPVDKLPDMAFDHLEIIKLAISLLVP